MNDYCQVLIHLLHIDVCARLTDDCTAVKDIDCVITYLFLAVLMVIVLCCIDLYTFYTNVHYCRCMLQSVYIYCSKSNLCLGIIWCGIQTAVAD